MRSPLVFLFTAITVVLVFGANDIRASAISEKQTSLNKESVVQSVVDSLMPIGSYLGDLATDELPVFTRWQNKKRKTLKVWIGGEAIPPYAHELTKGAMREWLRDPSLNMDYQIVPYFNRADIRIFWVDTIMPKGSAVTRTQYVPSLHIENARIIIQEKHRSGLLFNREEHERILLHEIGHALGLPHPRRTDVVMSEIVMVQRLTAADRASLSLLYKIPTGRHNF